MQQIRFMKCVATRKGVILDNGFEKHNILVDIDNKDDIYDFNLMPEHHVDFLIFLQLNQDDIIYYIKNLRKNKKIALDISLEVEGNRFINEERLSKLIESEEFKKKEKEDEKYQNSKWSSFLKEHGFGHFTNEEGKHSFIKPTYEQDIELKNKFAEKYGKGEVDKESKNTIKLFLRKFQHFKPSQFEV